MPDVNKPRPYKKEYQQQLERGDIPAKLERQRARRAIDKEGRDVNHNGKADKREGKDVAHIKALSRGGSNADGVRVESAAVNRSFKRGSDHGLVSETSTKERKKK
jgi:hypothetical protein